MSKYDVILIDADDTLLDFQAAERVALKTLLREMDLDNDAAAACYHRANDACWQALERGELTQERLRYKRFEDFLSCIERDDDPVQVGDRYMSLLAAQGMLLPDAVETVRDIARTRRVAIVTNGISVIQHGRIDRSPLAPYLSGLFISEEMGVAKPNPRILHEALRALGGVPPRRALMVGDSLKSDIACARNAGLDACWFNPRREPAPRDLPIAYEIHALPELVAVANT